MSDKWGVCILGGQKEMPGALGDFEAVELHDKGFAEGNQGKGARERVEGERRRVTFSSRNSWHRLQQWQQ